jgi:hypothetical protein
MLRVGHLYHTRAAGWEVSRLNPLPQTCEGRPQLSVFRRKMLGLVWEVSKDTLTRFELTRYESPANAGREPRRWQPRGLATTGVCYRGGWLPQGFATARVGHHEGWLPRGLATTRVC